MIHFLSIDSAMSNTGIAYGLIDPDTLQIEILEIALHETKPDKTKQIRKSSDAISRGRSTYRFIQEAIMDYKPTCIFIETPSGSQSSNGMKSYGMTCQLIACLEPEPFEVNPIEVKKLSIGNKNASKKDIIDFVYNLYPKLDWLKYRGNLQAKNEHCADAICIAIAGVQLPEFRRLIKLINK